MFPTLTRPRTLTTAGVTLGSAFLLGATLLPSLAQPSSPEASPDPQFRPVGGNGDLPSQAPELQEVNAPPNTAERGFAIRLAQNALPHGARDVLGNPGGEVLAADLPPSADRGASRRLAVSLYNYSSGRLHRMLVDLRAQSVISTKDVDGLQLPPTAAEASVATQLALEATPAPAFLKEYEQVTGSPLRAAEQLTAVAGVWRDTAGAADPAGPTQVCGANRCLQLLLALPSGQYLNTYDFAVDLTSRTVLPVRPKPHHPAGEQEQGHEH